MEIKTTQLDSPSPAFSGRFTKPRFIEHFPTNMHKDW